MVGRSVCWFVGWLFGWLAEKARESEIETSRGNSQAAPGPLKTNCERARQVIVASVRCLSSGLLSSRMRPRGTTRFGLLGASGKENTISLRQAVRTTCLIPNRISGNYRPRAAATRSAARSFVTVRAAEARAGGLRKDLPAKAD